MSALVAFMIAPLLVWAGLFFYLLSIDKQVRELKK